MGLLGHSDERDPGEAVIGGENNWYSINLVLRNVMKDTAMI